MSASFFTRTVQHFVIGCFFILMIALCIGVFYAHPQKTTPPIDPFSLTEASEVIVHTSFSHAETYHVSPESRILLVPHHLVAGREIASLLQSSTEPKEVLLLSPDHFAKGHQALSTTQKSFLWKNQATTSSPSLIQDLLTALPKHLRLQDDVFIREHGVRGLIPFLQTAWPKSSVTAITVRVDATDRAIEALAQTVHQELEQHPDLRIVMTIDFSHELPTYLADLHDAYAIQHLEALDEAAAKNVEIDSPPLFRLLIRLVQLQQKSLKLQAHTNSLTLMHATVTEHGTSHVLMSAEPSTTPPDSLSRYIFIHDPARHIISSEERAYHGYDQVMTASLPFPAAFIAEQTTTSTLWHALPLRQNADHTWELVSDQSFLKQQPQRTAWEQWAKTHLTSLLSE